MQSDFTYIIIWWVVPIAILGGRAALAGYRVRRKRQQLKQLEERSTPFTSKL